MGIFSGLVGSLVSFYRKRNNAMLAASKHAITYLDSTRNGKRNGYTLTVIVSVTDFSYGDLIPIIARFLAGSNSTRNSIFRNLKENSAFQKYDEWKR